MRRTCGRAQRTLAVAVATSLLALAMTLAAQAAPRGGGGDATGSRICSQLQSKLGDRFAKRFASQSDCEAQMAPVAQAARAACAARTPPTNGVSRGCRRSSGACTRTSRPSLQAMAGGRPGGRAARAAGALAQNHCTRIQAKNPTAFAKRFSDEAGCASRLSARAKTAIAGCAGAAKPRTAEFKACVKAALQAASHREVGLPPLLRKQRAADDGCLGARVARARRRRPVSARRRLRARAGPRRRRSRTSSRSGPASVPSRSIAVQRTRVTPAARQRSIASASERPEPRRPARGADLPVADVERDHEPLAERLDPRRRIGEGGRADDDAVGAGRRAARARRRASGCRRRPARARARPRRRRAGRAPAGRGPTRAPSRSTRWIRARPCRREPPRERDRLARPLDDLVVVSLVQAHGALAEHVDGGDRPRSAASSHSASTSPC